MKNSSTDLTLLATIVTIVAEQPNFDAQEAQYTTKTTTSVATEGDEENKQNSEFSLMYFLALFLSRFKCAFFQRSLRRRRDALKSLPQDEELRGGTGSFPCPVKRGSFRRGRWRRNRRPWSVDTSKSDWCAIDRCVCGECCVMQTRRQCVRCLEETEVCAKLPSGIRPQYSSWIDTCVMTLPKFTVVCLDIDVLDSFNRVLRFDEALVRSCSMQHDNVMIGWCDLVCVCVYTAWVSTLSTPVEFKAILSLTLTHSLSLSLSLSLPLFLFLSHSLTLARSLTESVSRETFSQCGALWRVGLRLKLALKSDLCNRSQS